MNAKTTLCAVIVFGALSPGAAAGEDWPTYLHDAARSGVTGEPLAPPLEKQWTFVSPHLPAPAWPGPRRTMVEGILELHKVAYDEAFQVVVAGGNAYFGSSADHKVYALDAATGAVRWTFFTGGPVRLAPTVWNEHVYAGSDDGFVYALRAEDGRPAWKFRAAPADERVLGNGRMISRWPVRTGVLVDQGTAYFGAGIFPGEGVSLYAVNAKDGRLIWKNDSFGRGAGGSWQALSPQGYLLASAEKLFAPCGRANPGAFDRADGRFLFQPSGAFHDLGGGTDALLADDYLLCGTNIIIAFDQKTGKTGWAWFRGRRLVAAPDAWYTATGAEMLALDRRGYPGASARQQAARVNLDAMKSGAKTEGLNRRKAALTKEIRETREELDSLTKQIADAPLRERADALSKAEEKKTAELAAVNGDLEKAKGELKTLEEEERNARAAVDACTKWRVAGDCHSTLILAGGVLYAGGKDRVVAAEAATGKQLWSSPVEGDARGLAVSNGRLFVSTDKGFIHCFGRAGAETRELRPAREATPYPEDALTPVYAAAAERIVRQTGIRKGYALVYGCGTGRLAFELAKRTDLRICGIEPDGKKVETARARLDAAGLYGTRVTVDEGALSSLPYSDYFANLIVSDDLLVSGRPEGSPKELWRTLKPCGGVLYLGQESGAVSGENRLDPARLREWLAQAGGEKAEVSEEGGVWARLRRGPLEGAGQWTHHYADAGNTACSGDSLVKCPLDLLWYGPPGPDKVVNRHSQPTPPLSLDGRFFVQGYNLVMAYDAYNGTFLWEREVPGAERIGVFQECGNLAVAGNGLFVATGDRCLRLDVESGETRQTYVLPPAADEKPRRWGYVACADGLLFGSRTEKGRVADALFAVDQESGNLRWVHKGQRISQITVAVGGGRVYLVESEVTPAQRDLALKEKAARLREEKGSDAFRIEKELKAADVRLVVALDARSGKKAWEWLLDLTDCGGNALTTMYRDGLLVLCGSFGDGHYWPDFLAGSLAWRRITVLSAADGTPVWSRACGYRTRPLVNGDTIYADPWAFDLRTGERKTLPHPVTGDPVPFEFGRAHHCGFVSAARDLLCMRSLTTAYYDLTRNSGLTHFGGHRAGCSINMIPAGGLVLEPESSSGCVCLFALQTTLAFKPGRVDRAWSQFCSQAPVIPVKHLAICLGAPGDRRDERGTLWLGYPRPGLPLILRLNPGVTFLPGGGYFSHEPETLRMEGTEAPWRFASGACGVTKCSLPLLGPDDAESLYTVRLGFAPLEGDRPGQRVFGVKLNGKSVREKLDPAKDGPNRVLVEEFADVAAKDRLEIELVPAVPNPPREQAPVLNCIEVVRTRVLGIGLAVPSFLLSDALAAEQPGEVRLENRQDEEFVGRLRVEAPAGFGVTPGEAEVRIAPGARKTVPLKAVVKRNGEPGDFEAKVSLVRDDGKTAASRVSRIRSLGRYQQVILKAVEDASVAQKTPQATTGSAPQLSVDGGADKMGDRDHSVAYLRFKLDIPGKPVSAVLRLYVLPAEGSESDDAGRVCLVEQPWSEGKITYENRPQPGREVGRLGRVGRGETVERPVQLNLEGLQEVSFALDPTSCDGTGFSSREGGRAPELVILYEPR